MLFRLASLFAGSAVGGRPGGALSKARSIAALGLLAIVPGFAGPARADEITTTRVSVGSRGEQPSGTFTLDPSLSGDGRVVAYSSDSANLVPRDANRTSDVFVRDRDRRSTRLVSVAADGGSGNGSSDGPDLSASGRYVAFQSFATDLVRGDTNGKLDVFIRDLETNATTRLSVAADGRQGNGASFRPSVSAEGRHVAFVSRATNLARPDTNGADDILVLDRRTRSFRRASVGPGGAQADGDSDNPAISAGGRFVAFQSRATNLVPGDTNGQSDIFVRDLQAGTTTRVSVGPGGAQGDFFSVNPAISADGRYVAFYSRATTLVPGDTNDATDVFVRDRATGTLARVSVGPGGAQGDDLSGCCTFSVSISADGQRVAFISGFSDLVAGDTNEVEDAFVHDRRTGVTSRASVGANGRQGDGPSSNVDISADGRTVGFDSSAANLVAGDTNGRLDVFVRGP